MANHDILFDYLNDKKDSLEEPFTYAETEHLAEELLDVTITGKQYAVLKFLQLYCNPVHVPEEDWNRYISSDPRRYDDLKQVKDGWRFELRTDGKATGSSKKATVGTDITQNLSQFPDYYRDYIWDGKHKLYGYPADAFPKFSWIKSLEARFQWFCQNAQKEGTASKYLLEEMIEWGGSQNGVLQKFHDGSGEVNLLTLINSVLLHLEDPEKAIQSALVIPGMGLTYASKLLRFMKPERYGALDSRIRTVLKKHGVLQTSNDVEAYVEFVGLLQDLSSRLTEEGIRKPDCELSSDGIWRHAEIEMALFQWADTQ